MDNGYAVFKLLYIYSKRSFFYSFTNTKFDIVCLEFKKAVKSNQIRTHKLSSWSGGRPQRKGCFIGMDRQCSVLMRQVDTLF